MGALLPRTFSRWSSSSPRAGNTRALRQGCSGIGMTPVCDHPSYCKNDKLSLYIGQSGHLSHPSHRNNNGYSPAGFAGIRDKFKGLCFYANNAAGARGLCNIPINSHSWRYPNQANPGFLCGKEDVTIFGATLGARGGVKANSYVFQKVKLTRTNAKYQVLMIEACKKISMKPVCDHRHYCRNDKNALYLGQAHHIGYPPHRRINSWFPSGWGEISDNWSGMCNYAGRVQGGGNALCNRPINTHSWQGAGWNPGFICGAVTKGCAATQVANSNKAKRGSISGKGGTRVIVTCNQGYKATNGGVASCGANGKFSTVQCLPAPCKPTEVLYSNYQNKGSIKANYGSSVTVRCASGYSGGGRATCGKNGLTDTSKTQCTKVCDNCKKCENKKRSACQKADADGNKKVNIEDLLILLSKFGNKC